MSSLSPDYGKCEAEAELRPSGMLVQKRQDDGGGGGDVVDHHRTTVGVGGPMIKITVYHGASQHGLHVPSQSTFGDLKSILVPLTGLEPEDQRLHFRGIERENDECLHLVGVKNMSKIMLLENAASRERKHEEMIRSNEIASACKAVADVRSEVDKLSAKVVSVESNVCQGTKVGEKELSTLTELLMRQLLRLDSIKAEGEAKLQRKSEVRRIQSLVDAVDNLKARNSNPHCSRSNAVSVTTEWETFDFGVGSSSSPPLKPSTEVTQDWEVFDD